MKKILLSLAVLVFCGGSAVAQVGSAASMARLIEEFPSPGGEFRTAPFMVWNTEVSKYQIDNMLNEYRRQGCGAVIIHPRPGLKTDYLSPEWLEMYKYTVDRGKLLGIDVWIYDENSYPSGFAGGHVYRQMPEAYNQGAGLMPTVVGVMPGDVSKYAVVVSEKGGKLTDVTAKAPKMKGKKGKFYLYEKTYYKVSPWYAGGSYVDLLADGVTGKFMEITMDGYEKTFGGDLKNNVKGILSRRWYRPAACVGRRTYSKHSGRVTATTCATNCPHCTRRWAIGNGYGTITSRCSTICSSTAGPNRGRVIATKRAFRGRDIIGNTAGPT